MISLLWLLLLVGVLVLIGYLFSRSAQRNVKKRKRG
jgi:hypothetical protein